MAVPRCGWQGADPRRVPDVSHRPSLEQWERFLWITGAVFAALALGFGSWRLKALWKERAEQRAAAAEWRRLQQEDERRSHASSGGEGPSQDQLVG